MIGNLGNAPEVKTLEGGSKLARLSVATNETYKNAKGEKVTETQWHNVIAWGKTAEIVEKYFMKGMEVLIEGKLLTATIPIKKVKNVILQKLQANELLILSNSKMILSKQ